MAHFFESINVLKKSTGMFFFFFQTKQAKVIWHFAFQDLVMSFGRLDRKRENCITTISHLFFLCTNLPHWLIDRSAAYGCLEGYI